ncbi:MAG: hypothetical protein LBG07_09720 [Treponema sp.]|jgi:hypothetical protein|nr:hypothetical protein [Treponema sp.]
MEKDILENPKNVKFVDLIQICAKYFGSPRICGSHHIFKMPWQGDPRINIQKDGNMAKEYQVKVVVKAIEKIKEDKYKEIKRDENIKPEKAKPRENKHGKK